MHKSNILKLCIIFFIVFVLAVFFAISSDNHIHNGKFEPIKVVYVVDNNYADYLRASVRSIIANKYPETKIEIYVLSDNLQENIKKKILSEQKKNVKIDIVPVSDNILKKLERKSKITNFVSRADNIKFFIPSVLSSINKVIYLDSDTIVLKDLSNLYYFDLGDKYIAAVKDWWVTDVEDSQKTYFNNGVMVMDLAKLRENNVEEKLIKYKKDDKFNRFVTQDAFNSVLYGQVIYLNHTYNTFSYEYDKLKKRGYKNHFAVIHYAGFYKPCFQINFSVESNRLWYKYAPPGFWLRRAKDAVIATN